jgi:hypothetical protein
MADAIDEFWAGVAETCAAHGIDSGAAAFAVLK